MSWRFKASKYKNAAPIVPVKEFHIRDLPIGSYSTGQVVISKLFFTILQFLTIFKCYIVLCSWELHWSQRSIHGIQLGYTWIKSGCTAIRSEIKKSN